MSKIAILDTSFITNWLNPKKNKEEVEKFRNFEDSVKKKKIIIAFPTPVISELLMGPVKSVSDDILGKNIKNFLLIIKLLLNVLIFLENRKEKQK